MEIHVRPARITDLETLVEFNAAMAYETEKIKLDLDILSAGVKAVFDQPERGTYYVAVVNSKVVGQLLITPEWSDWRNRYFWWIQSVYVPTEWRQHGIFKRLYEYVSDLARQQSLVCGLRLYVEKNNLPAQNIYRHLGMTTGHYLIFETELFPDHCSDFSNGLEH